MPLNYQLKPYKPPIYSYFWTLISRGRKYSRCIIYYRMVYLRRYLENISRPPTHYMFPSLGSRVIETTCPTLHDRLYGSGSSRGSIDFKQPARLVRHSGILLCFLSRRGRGLVYSVSWVVGLGLSGWVWVLGSWMPFSGADR